MSNSNYRRTTSTGGNKNPPRRIQSRGTPKPSLLLDDDTGASTDFSMRQILAERSQAATAEVAAAEKGILAGSKYDADDVVKQQEQALRQEFAATVQELPKTAVSNTSSGESIGEMDYSTRSNNMDNSARSNNNNNMDNSAKSHTSSAKKAAAGVPESPRTYHGNAVTDRGQSPRNARSRRSPANRGQQSPIRRFNTDQPQTRKPNFRRTLTNQQQQDSSPALKPDSLKNIITQRCSATSDNGGDNQTDEDYKLKQQELSLRNEVANGDGDATDLVVAAERASLNGARDNTQDVNAVAADNLAINESMAKRAMNLSNHNSSHSSAVAAMPSQNIGNGMEYDSQGAPLKTKLPPGAQRPGAYGGAPGAGYNRVASARYDGLGMQVSSRSNGSSNHLVVADAPPMVLERASEVTERMTNNNGNDDDVEGNMLSTSCRLSENNNDDRNDDNDKNQLEKVLGKQYKTILMVAGVLLLVIVLAIAIPLAAGGGGDGDDDDNGDQATPTTAPTEPLLVGIDPNLIPVLTPDTLYALTTDRSSPQFQAYSWISKDPNLENYEDWQLQQRFALGTFYYAFNGPNWQGDNVASWLDYDVNECQWMAYEPRACHDDGRIKLINMAQQRGFKGSLPPEISFLSRLEGLDFSENVLRQNLTELLSLSPNTRSFFPPSLQIIGCNNCRLLGSIPSTLTKLTNLLFLGLNENEISGTLPSEIGKLSWLTHWEMARNGISGAVPTEVRHLSSLKILKWSENKLERLPTEVGLLTNLELLDVGMNNIASPIPSEIGSLARLVALKLQDNRNMFGKIPSELGLLANLVAIHLDINKLTGAIPEELSQLSTKLELMFLSRNRLSGPIPSELGLMVRLSTLDVSNNNLTGSIPEELLELTSLNDFSYDGNENLEI